MNGMLVTGKGAYATKSIFLPAAGVGGDSSLSSLSSFGYYRSSTPDSGNSYHAWSMFFSSISLIRNYYDRYGGQSVRPVRGFAK